ncbi:MAG: ATP-binding protein, partial [Gammaproteobacteria bacterium]|nr:ATP-binding protein [Gammaproteobacteria bacterium]
LDLDPELAQVSCLVGEINQAILDIIVNAAHAVKHVANAEPSQKGLIRISTQPQDERVIIRVSDNGIGIPEAILPKIFEPFFTTKVVGQGTGQGLALVYSTIVDKHGGTIEVESEMGKGTVFIISLPIDEKG